MSRSRDYLTLADIIGIYSVLMKIYGGASGVRDQGALEAAVLGPQAGSYRGEFEEAAALMESLAINHPFVDGNRGISFAAADIFLRINGSRLEGDPSQFFYNIIHILEIKNFKRQTLAL